MEKAYREYTRWRKQKQSLPEALAAELCAISGDDNEIYNRFCRDISFGTSGLRAKMGAGSNRINSVTLRKASMGISRYLREKQEKPAIIIGFDTRNNSKEYAEIVAREFSENGVDVYVFPEPTPVPVVSFAVRDMAASGGIMITASHNTREYNGYKVYDHFGNQIDDQKAAIIESYMRSADPFAEEEPVPEKDREVKNFSECEAEGKAGGKAEGKGGAKGMIRCVPEDIKEKYLQALEENMPKVGEPEKVAKALSELKICYTPLNGTGMGYVPERLRRMGIKAENTITVESQHMPDGNFTTCTAPNPEYEETFSEAIKVCRTQEEKPALILATDPDSDRLGVMVLQDEAKGEYKKLSGNQVGELLMDYVCSLAPRHKNFVAFKSFVSSPLAEDIAKEYGVRLKNVFTGFKNIAFEMQRLKENPDKGTFLFGFEESLGYLYGDYTRDKDGIMAAQLVCLAAADFAAQGKHLTDRLEEIYRKHGYIWIETFAKEYENEADRKKASQIMQELFGGGLKTEKTQREYCYREKNMYCADLKGGHKFIIRPSGTEMKLKIYIFARDAQPENAKQKCAHIRKKVEMYLEKYDSRQDAHEGSKGITATYKPHTRHI